MQRKTFTSVIAILFFFNVVLAAKPSTKKKNKYNILFISVDDLRPELGCYGNKVIQTPNIDRLAQMGMTFTNAHCQVAISAPSRASMMTGLRPDSTHVWHLEDKFRQTIPSVQTMPQYFHQFGYYTVSIGKIFHNHMPDSVSFDEPDLRPAKYRTKDMVDRDAESFYYDDEINKELAQVREKRLEKNPKAYAGGWAYGRSTECSEAPDTAFYDGAQTELALQTIKRIKNKKSPFYLALGYFRPHLPFVAPKKYWDLYDRDKIPMANNQFLPMNAPVMASHNNGEMRGCYDLEYVKHPAVYRMNADTAKLLKHGYYASVSYLDACVGRLMQGLQEMNMLDNTIIVLWGDHGWKLGEHNAWGKHTNYRIDTRAPLIVYAPNAAKNGTKNNALVELVDVFPTLCDLSNVPTPNFLQGSSFKLLLNDSVPQWKTAVFSQYHRKPVESLDNKRYMGYSMTTSNYHYVEWRYWDYDKKVASKEVVARELYDLSTDPDENINIAIYPENQEVVTQLAEQLKGGWRQVKSNLSKH
ncbi:MAG: iduronate sulfatase [Bacteroidetes bacterium]|nr:iduronate sulfatase [Bacteroidota bacterium]